MTVEQRKDYRYFFDQLQKQHSQAKVQKRAFAKIGLNLTHAEEVDRGTWLLLFSNNDLLRKTLASSDASTEEIRAIYSTHDTLHYQSVAKCLGKSIPGRKCFQDAVLVISRDRRSAENLSRWSKEDQILLVSVPRVNDEFKGPEQIARALRAALMDKNFYYVGGPVQHADFFGREQLIDKVIADVKRGSGVGVFGMRKVGKTSLVQEVGRRVEIRDNQAFVFYDLEPLGRGEAVVGDMCKGLAEKFQVSGKKQGLKVGDLAKLVEDAKNRKIEVSPAYLYSALNKLFVDGRAKNVRFLLALDELESLVGPSLVATSGRPGVVEVLGTLRSLVQEHDNFNVMLAGLTSAPLYVSSINGRENPLLTWVKPYYVGPLDENESNEMISKIGRKMDLVWESAALRALYEQTSGHAFLQRSLASAVVDTVREAGSPPALDFEGRILVTHEHVKSAFRGWRRGNSQAADSMLAPLEKYYEDEAVVLRLFLDGDATIEELDDEHPAEVGRLLELGILVEDNSSHKITVSAWVELAGWGRR